MLEELFKLLNEARNEDDKERKLSLFEEYSGKLDSFLNNSESVAKVSKSDLERLNSLHTQVQKEVKSIFSDFKKSIKSFQKVNKGIKAYIGMPKSVTIRNTKKG